MLSNGKIYQKSIIQRNVYVVVVFFLFLYFCFCLFFFFFFFFSHHLFFFSLITAVGLAQSVERLTVEREFSGSFPGTGPILRVLKITEK